jgi:beta-lactamase regulating signal transducer with metallopeptidase domain
MIVGTIVAAALWAFGAGLALTLLVGVAVAAVIAATRPAAATRQALWTLALAVAGFAPIVVLAVMLVRGALGAPGPTPVSATAAHAGARTAAAATAQTGRSASGAGRAWAGPLVAVSAPPGLAAPLAAGIVTVWALGALVGLAGLARSIARVRALKRRSSPLEGTLATELPWLTTTAGREIYLRLSYETETPIAVGFRRPAILLPTEMATADGLTSIEPLIMHEYAHLARYDDWTNLAQRATERLFWFNPAVWILGRRIALEREVAADEAVVARTHDAKHYATTLWRMAQEMRMPEHVVVAPGAMLTRRQISVRIERLLEESPVTPRRLGAVAFAVTLLALTGVAGLAAGAPPVVLAQNDAGASASPALPAVAPVVRPVPLVRAADATTRIQAVVKQQLAGVQRLVAESGVHFGGSIATSGTLTRELIAACIGCDFSGHDLRGIDLSGTSLVGDDFDRANLSGVNLSHASLEGLSFVRADLRRANLHGAKLTGVDLTRANLDGADFSQSTLTGVDLSHASLVQAHTAGMHVTGAALP